MSGGNGGGMSQAENDLWSDINKRHDVAKAGLARQPRGAGPALLDVWGAPRRHRSRPAPGAFR